MNGLRWYAFEKYLNQRWHSRQFPHSFTCWGYQRCYGIASCLNLFPQVPMLNRRQIFSSRVPRGGSCNCLSLRMSRLQESWNCKAPAILIRSNRSVFFSHVPESSSPPLWRESLRIIEYILHKCADMINKTGVRFPNRSLLNYGVVNLRCPRWLIDLDRKRWISRDGYWAT